MIKELGPGLRLTLALTLVTGLLYPAILTPICQLLFPNQANGSLVSVKGQVVGSSLIGQPFTKPEYFHPRPSSAGDGYDAGASSGSNLGPTSARLLNLVQLRIVHYCIENEIPYQSSIPMDGFKDDHGNLDDLKLSKAFADDKAPLIFTPSVPIPADAVTASASGLDPHISPASASDQVARVARARKLSEAQVRSFVAANTQAPALEFLGEPRVNVLQLNLALDGK